MKRLVGWVLCLFLAQGPAWTPRVPGEPTSTRSPADPIVPPPDWIAANSQALGIPRGTIEAMRNVREERVTFVLRLRERLLEERRLLRAAVGGADWDANGLLERYERVFQLEHEIKQEIIDVRIRAFGLLSASERNRVLEELEPIRRRRLALEGEIETVRELARRAAKRGILPLGFEERMRSATREVREGRAEEALQRLRALTSTLTRVLNEN